MATKIKWVGSYEWFELKQNHIDRLEKYKILLNSKIIGANPYDKGVITKLQNHIKLAYLYPNNNNDLKKGVWADFITDKQAELLNELEFHLQFQKQLNTK
jgi:hypothetical protein